jgi:hypothetical protein
MRQIEAIEGQRGSDRFLKQIEYNNRAYLLDEGIPAYLEDKLIDDRKCRCNVWLCKYKGRDLKVYSYDGDGETKYYLDK